MSEFDRISRQMNEILERIRENEELARKFHEVESRILSVLDFKALFEVLLEEIGSNFSIPLVWFTLIEGSEVAVLLDKLDIAKSLDRIGRAERGLFQVLLGADKRPLLDNADLNRFAPLFPAENTMEIGSLALVPVLLDGTLIGSLNLADPSTDRYNPGYDTVFLERLAVKVSLCLSNVTAHEKLKIQAHRDPLTNLHNRRVMESALQREFDRAWRYGSSLSLVFMDLDDFKLVNDTYGHDLGDRLLKHVADLLRQACRSSDLVTRYAGDEFVLLLPETGEEEASSFIERLARLFEENPFTEGDLILPVLGSLGVSTNGQPGVETHEQLLKRADQNLYRDKDRRRRQRARG